MLNLNVAPDCNLAPRCFCCELFRIVLNTKKNIPRPRNFMHVSLTRIQASNSPPHYTQHKHGVQKQNQKKKKVYSNLKSKGRNVRDSAGSDCKSRGGYFAEISAATPTAGTTATSRFTISTAQQWCPLTLRRRGEQQHKKARSCGVFHQQVFPITASNKSIC